MALAGNSSMRWPRMISTRALLERLAQGVERDPGELGQLVEEEHAAVRQRELAGSRHGAAADEPLSGDRVMRRPERALADQPAGGRARRRSASE